VDDGEAAGGEARRDRGGEAREEAGVGAAPDRGVRLVGDRRVAGDELGGAVIGGGVAENEVRVLDPGEAEACARVVDGARVEIDADEARGELGADEGGERGAAAEIDPAGPAARRQRAREVIARVVGPADELGLARGVGAVADEAPRGRTAARSRMVAPARSTRPASRSSSSGSTAS
jgi:hypothetical protein